MCMPKWLEVTLFVVIIIWFIYQQVNGEKIIWEPGDFTIPIGDNIERVEKVNEESLMELRASSHILVVLFARFDEGEEVRHHLEANVNILETCAFNTTDLNIAYVVIDIKKHVDFAVREGIRSEWTLYLYKQGQRQPYEYMGHRMTAYILAYIRTMANDPVILIEGKDKPESFNNHKDHSRMVAYFQQGQMAENYSAYLASALQFQPHVLFYLVTNQKTASKFKLEEDGSMMLFTPYSEPISFNKPASVVTTDDVNTFIKEQVTSFPHKLSTMVDMNAIWLSPAPYYYILASIPDSQSGNVVFDLYKKFVKANCRNSLFKFVWIDPEEFDKIPELWDKMFDVNIIQPQIGLINTTISSRRNKWFNVDVLDTENIEEGLTATQQREALQMWLNGLQQLILKEMKAGGHTDTQHRDEL